MAERANLKFNETGRQPGDPSVELMQLLGALQRTVPDEDNVLAIRPDLYAEAIPMIMASSNATLQSKSLQAQGLRHRRLCGHWVTPAYDG